MTWTQTRLIDKAKPFLTWLDEWHTNLKSITLDEIVRDPARVAILSVDMLNGFCYEGTLSSPRAAACIQPIVELFTRWHARGVRHFLLIQEWHSADAEEFKAYGAHCVQGTREAEMVPEFAALPFANEFVVVHKNSIHAIVGTAMEAWLAQHPHVDTFICVGVCTDLCTYDMAIDLKLRANITDTPRRVIVPANCVNTYDLPVDVAQKVGALPHDGDLAHAYFLYMMALNKIEVVKEIG